MKNNNSSGYRCEFINCYGSVKCHRSSVHYSVITLFSVIFLSLLAVSYIEIASLIFKRNIIAAKIVASLVKPPSLFPILLVNFVGTLGFSIVLPFLVFLVMKFGGVKLFEYVF